MSDGLRRAKAAAKKTQTPRTPGGVGSPRWREEQLAKGKDFSEERDLAPAISNARTAHVSGKVWVTVSVNGGDICLKSGGPPIGSMTLKGPMSAEQSFVLWMAAKGLDPIAIAEEVSRFAKAGGNKEQPVTLRALLEAVRDGLGGPGDEIPPAFAKLREDWLACKTPGL